MYFARSVLKRFRHFFDRERLLWCEPFPLHDLLNGFSDTPLTGHHIAFDGRFRTGRAFRARCENQYRQEEGETGGSEKKPAVKARHKTPSLSDLGSNRRLTH